MNRFFQQRKHSANIGYHGHDLSHSFGTTFSSSMLLPIDWHFLNPGDKINVDECAVVKTTDMLKPSSTSGKFKIQHFFVPIRLLDSYFSSKFFNVNLTERAIEVQSHLTKVLPYFTLQDCVNSLFGLSATDLANRYRLLDALGYNISFTETGAAKYDPLRRVSAYPLLAYQRIYNDYFRLTDWEPKAVDTFNIDDYPAGTVNAARLRRICQLRFAPLHSDYFNYFYPSPLQTSDLSGGSQISQPLDYKFLSEYFTQNSQIVDDSVDIPFREFNDSENGSSVANSFNAVSNYLSTQIDTATQTLISTANIRNMFAVEKILEITRRAKKSYDAQVLAHFGVNPHSDRESIRFRSVDFDLTIGQVVSSANTSEGVLGERAGLGSGQKAFTGTSTFTANEHGVYMALVYFVPDVKYAVDGVLDELGAVTADMFYHPEFDKLGMEPMWLNELQGGINAGGGSKYFAVPQNGNSEVNSPAETSRSFYRLIGWRDRYAYLKIAPNLLRGGLKGTRSYKEWSPQRTPDNIVSTDSQDRISAILKREYGTYLNSILVIPYAPNPLTGDDITAIAANKDFARVFDTDPFIFDGYIKFHKASKMSSNSLPNL